MPANDVLRLLVRHQHGPHLLLGPTSRQLVEKLLELSSTQLVDAGTVDTIKHDEHIQELRPGSAALVLTRRRMTYEAITGSVGSGPHDPIKKERIPKSPANNSSGH